MILILSRFGWVNTFSIYKSPWCHILWNACWTSRKTDMHIFYPSRLSLIRLTILQYCCIGECFPQSPNWCRGIRSSCRIICFMLLSNSLSNIFDSMHRSLISRYNLTSVGALPGFSDHDNLSKLPPLYRTETQYIIVDSCN